MANEPAADVDIDKSGHEDRGTIPRRRQRPVALLAAAGVLMLALAAGYLLLRRGSSETSPTAGTSDTPSAQQAEPEEQILLPPLDETDALVRQLVGRLSSHPAVAAWLTTDGLILNFVLVTTKIANGESPVGELKAIGPVPRFRTRKSRNILSIDPASYRRYDRYAEAVSALDAAGTARLYATIKPRVLDAYRRTGHPDGDFDPVLERAVVELLKTPVVEGEIALEEQAAVGFAFSDPRLQGTSAAQKHLLRMGPQNVRTVQGKLRDIASALGIPESRLPPPTVLSR
jgi:hypothetical protein